MAAERVAIHRRRHIKLLAGGLVVAVIVHVALFVANPALEIPVVGEPPPPLEAFPRNPQIVSVNGAPPDPLFGQTVYLTRGTLVGRDLLIRWPSIFREHAEGGSVTLRIHVDSVGAVTSAAIAETSGDAGKDSAFVAVARSFKYEWRAERGPNRMELLQPLVVRPT